MYAPPLAPLGSDENDTVDIERVDLFGMVVSSGGET